jgi:hypothetical protein
MLTVIIENNITSKTQQKKYAYLEELNIYFFPTQYQERERKGHL